MWKGPWQPLGFIVDSEYTTTSGAEGNGEMMLPVLMKCG